jgi:hypothetical protein
MRHGIEFSSFSLFCRATCRIASAAMPVRSTMATRRSLRSGFPFIRASPRNPPPKRTGAITSEKTKALLRIDAR